MIISRLSFSPAKPHCSSEHPRPNEPPLREGRDLPGIS